MPGSPTGRIGEAPSPNPRVGVSCDNPLLVATMKKKARQQMLGPVSIDEGVELMFAAAEAHPSWEVLPHRELARPFLRFEPSALRLRPLDQSLGVRGHADD